MISGMQRAKKRLMMQCMTGNVSIFPHDLLRFKRGIRGCVLVDPTCLYGISPFFLSNQGCVHSMVHEPVVPRTISPGSRARHSRADQYRHSTSGPMTVQMLRGWMPKTAMATAIASSKLLDAQ